MCGAVATRAVGSGDPDSNNMPLSLITILLLPIYFYCSHHRISSPSSIIIGAKSLSTMSSETRPISPHSFAQAIEDLPLENIYGKAYEINNSIAHLQQSNKVLQEYSDSIKEDASLDAGVRAEGDKDCLDAIRENEVVIGRQRDRVRLLKAEVERRGQLWHEVDPDSGEKGEESGVNASVMQQTDADARGVQQSSMSNGNGSAAEESNTNVQALPQQQQPQQQPHSGSGRLTDEELQRRLQNMLPDDEDDEANGGLHL